MNQRDVLMELVLEVINPPDLKEGCSPSWRFNQSGGVLGRSPECEWRIEDQALYVSRQHARISHEDNVFYLTDISRNGTLLNGVETLYAGERRCVRHGDTFRIGDLELRACLLGIRSEQTCQKAQSSINGLPVFAELDPLAVWQAGDKRHCRSDELSSLLEERVEFPGIGRYSSTDREQLRLPELIPAPLPAAQRYAKSADEMTGLFCQRLAEALDVDLSGVDSTTCEALAIDAARLFRQCIDGLEHGSSTRNELDSELGGCRPASGTGRDRPVDSLDASSIIQLLLHHQSGQASRMITQSFRASQSHQVALLAGCRAMARSALEHFSPQRLHWQFEHEDKSWLRTAGSRWRAYVHHHRTLAQDDQWTMGLWNRDFLKAYDEQIRLINTLYPN